MRKTKDDADRTCQSILKSALNVFVAKGVAMTTMEEIAKRANISRGAIYWHFKNKEKIIESIVSSTPGPIACLYEELSRCDNDTDSVFVCNVLKNVLTKYSRRGSCENKVAQLLYYKNGSSFFCLKVVSIENLLSNKCLGMLTGFYGKEISSNRINMSKVACAFFLWKAVLHENLLGNGELIDADVFEEGFLSIVRVSKCEVR